MEHVIIQVNLGRKSPKVAKALFDFLRTEMDIDKMYDAIQRAEGARRPAATDRISVHLGRESFKIWESIK